MAYFIPFLAVFAALTWHTRSDTSTASLGYDPIRLFRSLILGCAILWLLPLFTHRPDVNYAWYALYFGAATLSMLAWWAGSRVSLTITIARMPPRVAMGALVAASLPFFTYYVVSGNFFDDIQALTHLSLYDLRKRHWASFGSSNDRLAMALGCLAFPVAHLWPLRSPRSLTFWYSLALFTMFVVSASTSGGRATVVFSVVVCYLLLHTRHQLQPWRLIRTRPALFALILAGITAILYYLFYYVMTQRAPGLESAYYTMSMVVVGAPPTDLLANLNRLTGGIVGVLALSVGYFSSTLTFYGLFATNVDACDCVGQYGVYNFPFIDSLAGADWFQLREKIGHFWRAQGVGTNPWASAYRDWMIDFGAAGSFLFNAIFFFSLGWLVRSASARSDDIARLITAFTAAVVLVTPLLSPLLMLVISIPFYGLALLYALTQGAHPSVTGLRVHDGFASQDRT